MGLVGRLTPKNEVGGSVGARIESQIEILSTIFLVIRFCRRGPPDSLPTSSFSRSLGPILMKDYAGLPFLNHFRGIAKSLLVQKPGPMAKQEVFQFAGVDHFLRREGPVWFAGCSIHAQNRWYFTND